MSDGQVKNYSIRLYFLECPALFCNRTSTNLGVLVPRTSEHFKIFLPLWYKNYNFQTNTPIKSWHKHVNIIKVRPYCDEVSLMYGQRARVVHVSVILHRPCMDCKTCLCNQTDQHNDEDATYNTPITAQCVRYTSNTRCPGLARCPGSVYLMTANKTHNIKNFRLIRSVIFCIFLSN